MNLSLCADALTNQPHSLEQFNELFVNGDDLGLGQAFFHKGSTERIVKPDVQDLSEAVQFMNLEHLLYYR